MNFNYRLPPALIGVAAILVVHPQVAVPQAVDEQAIAAIAKEVTVIVNGQNPGSGVIISRLGNTYSVLTAKHVVATSDEYQIVTADAQKHALDYSTVKKLPGVDLAVVQFTSDQNYPVAILGDADPLKEGATVYTSGWPHPGRTITERIFQITQGRISGLPLQPLEDGYALVYTNVTRSGMSGGPVFDGNGRVIGIHGRAEGQPIFNPDTGDTVDVKSGFNLGIPINSFLKLASQAGINLPYSGINFSLFQTLDAGAVVSVAISPDGQTLVSGSKDGSIQVWNLRTGELKSTLAGHSNSVSSLAIAPDNQTLASSGMDGTIKLWNLGSGQLQHTLSGYGPAVISRDGQTLAGISDDLKAIKLWNLQTGQLKKTLKLSGEVTAIAINPDSQTLVSNGKGDENIKIWDLRSEAPPRTLNPENPSYATARCINISPDGRILATMNLLGIRLWNLQTGELVRTFDFSEGDFFACESLSFDPNGQILASSSWNPQKVNLWNLQTTQVLSVQDATHPIAISSDGQTLVTGNLLNPNASSGLKIWRSPGR